MIACALPPAARFLRAAAALALLASLPLLAACGSGGRDYPGLASGERPEASSSAERRQIAESLAADRENARYQDQQLRGGGEPGAASMPATGTPSTGASPSLQPPADTFESGSGGQPASQAGEGISMAPARTLPPGGGGQGGGSEAPSAPAGVSLDFAPGSAELDAAARQRLAMVADRLRADEAARVEVLAHSSPLRNESQTRRLALDRGLAVRAWLIEQGVDRTRLDVRAMGAVTGSGDRVDLVLR